MTSTILFMREKLAEGIAAASRHCVIVNSHTGTDTPMSRIYGRKGGVFLALGSSKSSLCTDALPKLLQMSGIYDAEIKRLAAGFRSVNGNVAIIVGPGPYCAQMARDMFWYLYLLRERMAISYGSAMRHRPILAGFGGDDAVVILGPQAFVSELLHDCCIRAGTIRIFLSDGSLLQIVSVDVTVVSRN